MTLMSCMTAQPLLATLSDTRPQKDGPSRELLKEKSLHNISWRCRSEANKLEASKEPGFLISVLPEELAWF